MQFSPSLPRVLTIRLKLILAFGALIALLLAMAGVGAWRLAELNAAATQMASFTFLTPVFALVSDGIPVVPPLVGFVWGALVF